MNMNKLLAGVGLVIPLILLSAAPVVVPKISLILFSLFLLATGSMLADAFAAAFVFTLPAVIAALVLSGDAGKTFLVFF
jgi:hypothetical protein